MRWLKMSGMQVYSLDEDIQDCRQQTNEAEYMTAGSLTAAWYKIQLGCHLLQTKAGTI
jgi:hypothetical protein